MIISLLFSIGQFVLLDSLPLQRHDPIFSQFSQINRIQQNLWWFIGGLADWYYIENILSLNLIYFIRRFLSISHDLLCISIGFVTFKLLLISVFWENILQGFFFISVMAQLQTKIEPIFDVRLIPFDFVFARSHSACYENYQVYISCVSRSAFDSRRHEPTNAQSKCNLATVIMYHLHFGNWQHFNWNVVILKAKGPIWCVLHFFG